jgi:MFS family permease
MVSLFFIVSGTGQALAGFLVDRVGARPVLFAALGSFVVAGLVASTAQGYAMLLLASLFAGLGNAPFHPVDFTILNKRVSPQRIGHAFSVHGLSGKSAGPPRRCSWPASPPPPDRGVWPACAARRWRPWCWPSCWSTAAGWTTAIRGHRQPGQARRHPGRCGRQAGTRHGLPEAALGVAVLLVLLLEHLRHERHPELRQPRCAPSTACR